MLYHNVSISPHSVGTGSLSRNLSRKRQKKVIELNKTDEISCRVSQKLGMGFSNAHEAWWFLYYHPKFTYHERTEFETEADCKVFAGGEDVLAGGGKARAITTAIKDAGGNWWVEWKYECHALDEQLDIHYAQVDETGHVNKDESKNVNIECWLEFGPVEWGYDGYADASKGERERLLNYHDIDLDCGAPTFDEAIVELANLVLEKYGPLPDLK